MLAAQPGRPEGDGRGGLETTTGRHAAWLVAPIDLRLGRREDRRADGLLREELRAMRRERTWIARGQPEAGPGGAVSVCAGTGG